MNGNKRRWVPEMMFLEEGAARVMKSTSEGRVNGAIMDWESWDEFEKKP